MFLRFPHRFSWNLRQPRRLFSVPRLFLARRCSKLRLERQSLRMDLAGISIFSMTKRVSWATRFQYNQTLGTYEYPRNPCYSYIFSALRCVAALVRIRFQFPALFATALSWGPAAFATALSGAKFHRRSGFCGHRSSSVAFLVGWRHCGVRKFWQSGFGGCGRSGASGVRRRFGLCL